MSPELISFITVALAIFIVCAGFVLLRGAMRMFIGCAILTSSAWVGFRTWQLAPDLVKACFGTHLQWLTGVLPVIAFLVTFILARTVVKFISAPFQNPANDLPPAPLTLTRLLMGVFFTLIPTVLVGTIAAILIYHAGAVTELRDTAGNKQHSRLEVLALDLKKSVVAWIPQKWLQVFDPLIDPSRLALAKAIAQEAKSPHKPEIDPATGKPIPRAIIVDDPELQNLVHEGRFSTLLRHPLLTKPLQDPKVQAFLKDLHF